jgi:hypothetical protein
LNAANTPQLQRGGRRDLPFLDVAAQVDTISPSSYLSLPPRPVCW